MSERKWNSGPPPHVGWWNASTRENPDMWRWWDGKQWSFPAFPFELDIDAARFSTQKSDFQSEIKWTDYYPENARVPRINPEKQ